MVRCSVTQCNAMKNSNQPELTIHRFPRNEVLRQKWLASIGTKNLSPHKELYVCSLHFEESCFNKTLDVVRLRDNAVPSLLVPAEESPVPILQDIVNVREETISTITQTESPKEDLSPASKKDEPDVLKDPPPARTLEVLAHKTPIDPALSPLPPKNLQTTSEPVHQSIKYVRLQKICIEQRKVIKRLQAKNRRQERKMAKLFDVITELKKKVILNQSLNTEEAIILVVEE